MTRREARTTATWWICACLWVVGSAALLAYRKGAQPEALWGIPTWVWLSVLLPWGVVTLITVWYAICRMNDEDLGEDTASRD